MLAPGEPERRLPTLDGVRGLAILMVMIFHMSLTGFVDPQPSRPWGDRAWLRAAMFGWSGVDLFFVLSGLLITGVLLDAKRAGGPGYFRSFYARRALRVFPLYYAVVAFSLLVLPHVPNARADRFGSIRGDEVWYWTLLSNWSIGWPGHGFRHGILDVSWSLAIEEQFYLLWPAVVLFASRRTLGWTCAALVGVSIATRWMLVLHGASNITVLALTPCRMDALAAGSFLAVLARRPGGLAAARPALRWAGGVAGLMLAADVVWHGSDWTHRPVAQTVGFTFVAVAYAAGVGLAAAAADGSWVARGLGLRPLPTLGRLSFALYLFHAPIRGVIRDTVYGVDRFATVGRSQLPGQFIFYAVSIAASVAAAAVSWRVLERPALRLKRFFPMPSEPSGSAAGSARGVRRAWLTGKPAAEPPGSVGGA